MIYKYSFFLLTIDKAIDSFYKMCKIFKFDILKRYKNEELYKWVT